MSPSTRAQYLLLAEAEFGGIHGNAWRFVLERVDQGTKLSVSDFEVVECRDRLELLAVVRGLEAIDEPARVTLVTSSRYVSRGLKLGLPEWRTNGWQWERFGNLAPIRDQDLWRRVDVALRFHEVQCRLWRFAGPDLQPAAVDPLSRRPAGQRLATAARERLRQLSAAAAALGQSIQPTGLAAG